MRNQLLAAVAVLTAALSLAQPSAAVPNAPIPIGQPTGPSGPEFSDGLIIIDDQHPAGEGGASLDPGADHRGPLSLSQFQRRFDAVRTLSAAPASQAAAGGFTACYDPAVPLEIRSVAERALSQWSRALKLAPASIEVDIFWVDVGSPSTLAASGPSRFVRDQRLPDPTLRYPVALASHLTGIDFSPRPVCDQGQAGDVVVYINRTFGAGGVAANGWNLTEDAPAAGQIDLETVLMHELGHGLGFLASAALDSQGRQRWPHDGGAPYVFESLIRRCGDGDTCLRESSQPVAVASDATLTSNDLWLSAPNAELLQLYAPTGWSTGSSLSHLDEVRYPKSSVFSLMTPFIGRGEQHQAVDHATLTAMQAMGWQLSSAPAAPSNLSVTAGNGRAVLDLTRPPLTAAVPPIDYELDLWRNGAFDQTVRIPTVPVEILGLQNGATYQFVARAVNAGGQSPPTDPSVPVRPLELPPFSTAEAFVDQVFNSFLGRAATGAERSVWTQRARSGQDPATVVAEITDLPAIERQRRIIRLYLGFFDRQPDLGGLRFWIGRGETGESLERIALQFATASEFEQGRAVTDADFVIATYERVLGRAPDASGLSYWVDQLGTGLDRGRLLLLFSESPEHRRTTEPDSAITAIYTALVGRLPTTVERAEWTPVVERGGVAELVGVLLASDEFNAD